MKKYIKLLRYEFKTLVKDPMNLFMLLYPFLILFICGWMLPAILVRTNASAGASAISLLLGFALSVSLGGYVMGAMLGFSLIENRDENTLISIAVTPASVKGYAAFKSIYAFVFAFLGNIIMVGGLKLLASNAYIIDYGSTTVSLLGNISYFQIVVFSFVSGLIVPFFGGLFASISKNKIEGFAIMKTGGVIVMIPMLCLLNAFSGGWQYALSFTPNFWTVKALLNIALQSTNSANLNFWVYMAIGAVYQIILCVVGLGIFIKKSETK